MDKPTYEEMETVKINCRSKANKYLGKSIWYLRKEDCDQSGRGYYWVRFMKIKNVSQKEFIDITGNSIYYKDIIRIKEIIKE